MCSKLLAKTAPGTFLIRDSSDPNYLFTLSLQTGKRILSSFHSLPPFQEMRNWTNKGIHYVPERGPTSVRLVYYDGGFRLDAADQRLIGALPSFPNVVQLVQYYVEEYNGGKRRVERVKSGINRQVCETWFLWMDNDGMTLHLFSVIAGLDWQRNRKDPLEC